MPPSQDSLFCSKYQVFCSKQLPKHFPGQAVFQPFVVPFSAEVPESQPFLLLEEQPWDESKDFWEGQEPMVGNTWQAQMSSRQHGRSLLAPYAGSAGSGDSAPERQSPWLLRGGGHLGGDKSLDDTMVGWQQVAVPVG